MANRYSVPAPVQQVSANIDDKEPPSIINEEQGDPSPRSSSGLSTISTDCILLDLDHKNTSQSPPLNQLTTLSSNNHHICKLRIQCEPGAVHENETMNISSNLGSQASDDPITQSSSESPNSDAYWGRSSTPSSASFWRLPRRLSLDTGSRQLSALPKRLTRKRDSPSLSSHRTRVRLSPQSSNPEILQLNTHISAYPRRNSCSVPSFHSFDTSTEHTLQSIDSQRGGDAQTCAAPFPSSKRPSGTQNSILPRRVQGKGKMTKRNTKTNHASSTDLSSASDLPTQSRSALASPRTHVDCTTRTHHGLFLPPLSFAEASFGVIHRRETQSNVLIEDTDEGVSSLHGSRLSSPSNTMKQLLTRSVPSGPKTMDIVQPVSISGASMALAQHMPILKKGNISTKRALTLPPYSSSPDLDKFVFSSAARFKSADIQISSSNRTNEVEIQITEFARSLAAVLRDWRRYQKLLEFRGSDAQRVLDCVQILLDYFSIEAHFRAALLVVLIRLSRVSDLYPQRLTLTSVTREDEYPAADGHFCEIHKGRLDGQLICVKIIKMYTVSNQDEFRKACCREAVLWSQMSHPNVLPLYGIYKLGDTRNRIALIFPWIPNGTVNEFLRTKPDADRGVLVAGVAAGMSYLHKNQVVHGDIRGASILVSDSGRACLTDFGLASIAEAHGVQHPGFSSSGIVRFQAPELIDPDFDCPRSKPSDVYAFAMSSYQIYTGHRPFFELERDYGVLIKVSRGERPEKPLDPFCKDRGLTDFIWELIQECWEQIPSKRPSAAQIVERLSREFSRNLLEQDDWKDLSPARFRQGHSYSDQIKNTMIEETLCLLQTTRVFVS